MRRIDNTVTNYNNLEVVSKYGFATTINISVVEEEETSTEVLERKGYYKE